MLVLLSSQFVGLGTEKLAIRMEKQCVLRVCVCVSVLTGETNRTHK